MVKSYRGFLSKIGFLPLINLKIDLLNIKKPALIQVFTFLSFSLKLNTLFFLPIERTPNRLWGFIEETNPIFLDFLNKLRLLFKSISDNPSQYVKKKSPLIYFLILLILSTSIKVYLFRDSY